MNDENGKKQKDFKILLKILEECLKGEKPLKDIILKRKI